MTQPNLKNARGPILVATDLTEGARPCTAWGHALGHLLDRPTVAAHVIEPRLKGLIPNRPEPDLTDARIEGIRGLLDVWYQETTGVTPADTEIAGGHAPSALAQMVEGRDASMLVMARTSKGVVQQALLGSRVQQVAQKPPCPLVVVHPESPTPAKGMHIAVATDFSEASAEAVRFAAQLAYQVEGRLSLIHCTYIPPSTHGAVDRAQEQELAVITDICQRELEMIRASLWSDFLDLKIDLHVLSGRPTDLLLEFDREENPSLLVVGQTGQASALGALLGSVPRRLLQQIVGNLCIVPQ